MIGVGEYRRPVTAAWMEVGEKNRINFSRQISIDRHNATEKTSADNSETESQFIAEGVYTGTWRPAVNHKGNMLKELVEM